MTEVPLGPPTMQALPSWAEAGPSNYQPPVYPTAIMPAPMYSPMPVPAYAPMSVPAAVPRSTPAPEPATVTESAPVAAPKPEPVAAQAPVTTADAAPVVEQAPIAKPAPVVEPAPVVDSAPAPQPVAVATPKVEANPTPPAIAAPAPPVAMTISPVVAEAPAQPVHPPVPAQVATTPVVTPEVVADGVKSAHADVLMAPLATPVVPASDVVAPHLGDLTSAAPAAAAITPAAVDIDALTHFDFDSAELTIAGRAALDGWVAAAPAEKTVKVVGHADRLGPEPYNLKLSLRRAQAVKQYLVGKGVNPRRIEIEAKGESEPVKRCKGGDTPATKACLAPNRRVKIAP
jgi:outer membrane protein OmpA-like peptidoglycan-associated protein